MAGIDIISDSTGKEIVAAIQATDVAQARISEINTAAELKKKEVLESIPEDYSNLSGDVRNLKSDVSELSGDVSELSGDVSELKGDLGDLSQFGSIDISTYPSKTNYALDGNGTPFYVEGYTTTEFIKVGSKIIIKTANSNYLGIGVYDADKNKISVDVYTSGNESRVIELPNNASYIKIARKTVDTSIKLIDYDTTIVSNLFLSQNEKIRELNEKIGDLSDCVETDISTYPSKTNYALDGNGDYFWSEGNTTTNFIEAKGKIIIKSDSSNYLGIGVYDADKNKISVDVYTSGNESRVIELPNNASYIKIARKTVDTSIKLIIYDDAVVSKIIKRQNEKIDSMYDNNFKTVSNVTELVNAFEKGGNYYIKSGTYDIIAYLGDDYLNNFSANDRGIEVADGNYVFAPNAYIVADYSNGYQVNVKNGFAPINLSYAHNVKFVGMNVYANTMKYCVHDEMGGELEPYVHEYINCTFKQKDCNECLGGGLGYSGNIVIDGCIFEGETYKETDIECSYHNDYRYGAKSSITIKNSIIKTPNKTFRFGYYGDSIEKTTCIVSNCIVGKEPFVKKENENYNNINMELYSINNVIQNN